MEDLEHSSEEQTVVLSNGTKTNIEPHEEIVENRDETSSLSAKAPEFYGSSTQPTSAQSDQVTEGKVDVTAEHKR